MEEPSQFAATKFVDIVSFPLPTRETRQLCGKSIHKAECIIEEMRAQMACLDLQTFFDQNPEVQTISFSGSWNSNDEGGSEFHLSTSIYFAPESGMDDDDEAVWELEDEARSIVSRWGESLHREKFHRDGGAERLGRILMDERVYAQWRSSVEQTEIDSSTPQGAPRAEDAPRL